METPCSEKNLERHLENSFDYFYKRALNGPAAAADFHGKELNNKRPRISPQQPSQLKRIPLTMRAVLFALACLCLAATITAQTQDIVALAVVCF